MLLDIISWDGHALNDSNYSAWFEVGSPEGVSARPNYSPRSKTYPILSSTDINGTSIVMHIAPKGTIHSQLDQLDAWFNVYDNETKAFVVENDADSKQWYVMAKPVEPVRVSEDGVGEYVVTLAVDEPLWRSVVVADDLLAVTTSGDDVALTIGGNWYARPVLTLSIGGAKNGGYKKTLWKPWYNPSATKIMDVPFDFTNGGINTTNLVSDTTVSNQINVGGGITAIATSIPIDTSVGGGLPTTGGMCYCGTEQIYYTGISAGTMTVYNDGAGTTGRGWGGTTAAVHADNAFLYKSHVLANLNDVRMFDGDQEIDCWVSAVGSATKVWIKRQFLPAVTMTLGTALSAGTITSVSVKRNQANKRALLKMPQKFMALIDSEIFFCESPRPGSFTFAVAARGQKGTTAATHAAGATIRWMEHDLTLAYDNPLAEAPERDDEIEPIFDQASSTNASWVYTILKSGNNLRSAGWNFGITRRKSPAIGGNSRIYTATQNADADPATDLGFAIKSYYSGAAWKVEDFGGFITLYHPAGFTTVTVTGSKRRETVDWPSFTFQKSLDGVTWVTVFTEAKPTTAAAWVSLASHSSVSLSGDYPFVRWLASGGLRAVANNAAYLEMSGGTFIINSSNILQVAFATTVNNAYYLDATIGITETGENIRLQGTCKNDSVIVIDCDKETITLDGLEGGIAISWNTERNDWLSLPSPSQYATCTLYYIEDGVTDVELAPEWEDRQIL